MSKLLGRMQTILMGVTSGIAAFKVIDLVRKLKKKYNVIVIMSEHAKKMISPNEFKKLKVIVVTDLFPKNFDYKEVLKKRKVEHISLADKADLICVVPATANVIGKLSNGIADDLLTTTILASKANLLVCPSMNVNMWNNQLMQYNLKKMKKNGVFIIEPESGDLACGYQGKGRLASIEYIEKYIDALLEKGNELKGKRIIVTAGAIEEKIDDVRVLTNKSSGRMGIAIAEECVKRGGIVTLIRGRTDVEPSILMRDIKIENSDEMEKLIKDNIKKKDFIIHAAAVSDFKIKKRKGKIKSGKMINLKLVPSKKIIDNIKKWNSRIKLIGFKAGENLITEGKNLLNRSKADIIVANNVKNIGSKENEIFIIKKRSYYKIKKADKKIIAEKIIDELSRI